MVGVFRALILILFLVSGLSTAFAAAPVITNGTAYVFDNGEPSDNIARIGDRISYTVYFTSDISAPQPTAFVVVPAEGNPNVAMSVTNLGGTSYAATVNWTVLQGSKNNTEDNTRFIVGNTDGIDDDSSYAPVKLDNVRPERSGIMTAKVNGSAGFIDYTGTPVKKGETVTFYQNLSTSDTLQTANLNLANISLANNNPMTHSNAPALPPQFILQNINIPDNLDGAYQIPVTLTDGRGNFSVHTDFSLNADTRAPFIAARSVTNAAGSTVTALPGHVLNFSITINGYDNDVVTVECASFTDAGITLPTLTPTSTPSPGANITYTATLFLTENPLVFGNQYPFVYRVVDNAGNVSTATAYLGSIDLALPSQDSANASVYSPPPLTFGPTYVASLSTRLQFKTEITSEDPLNVTVDLTAIGGSNAYALGSVTEDAIDPKKRTYIGTYTLSAGTPVDGVDMNFVITGRAASGNLVFKTTTPDILIDNVPPAITSLTLTKASGTGPIVVGDQVTVEATVTGVNTALGGKVWIDLTALGGATEEILTNENQNFWRKTITVASGSVDTSKFFKVYAWDRSDVMNQVTFDSAATQIDTEPPAKTESKWSFVVQPTGGRTQVNNGDQLRFEVALASSSFTTPYDGQTVMIDLSSAGGLANQQMTLLATGYYTCTFTVPLGNLTDGATFPIIISDNDGNRAFTYDTANKVADLPWLDAAITIPDFDQAVPVITAFTMTRDAGAGIFKIGDAVTFQATVDGVLAGGNVWSDFRGLGVPDSASYTFTNLSGNTWQANVVLGSGTIDLNNVSFTVFAYNREDHQTSLPSTGYQVDNLPPFFVDAYYTSNPPQDASHPYVKIGDDITLTVELDSTRANDGHDVNVDLTALGGEVASLTRNAIATWVFEYTFKLATGTVNSSVNLPVTIIDNAGNSPFDATTHEPVIASITIAELDQLAPEITTFTVTRDAGPGTIIINDSITFNAVVTNIEEPDGAVWLDLRRLGGPGSATFDYLGSNNWQYQHVVGTGTSFTPEGAPIDSASFEFTLYAYDKASNTFTLKSTPTSIDNIAPELAEPMICTFTPVLQKKQPYMIIEDTFKIQVQLKTPDDSHSVKVDLSSLGNLSIETLNHIGGGFYETAEIQIATGPLNLGATFPITITDDAGNGPVFGAASQSFVASATWANLDQNPPDPGVLELLVTRDPSDITDPSDISNFINTHKILTFRLPFTSETKQDHATATIDLEFIPELEPRQNSYLDANTLTVLEGSYLASMSAAANGSYSLRIDIGSFTAADIGKLFTNNYKFTATMYDRSGNLKVTETSAANYRIDCFPPEIASISATVDGGGSIASLSSKITFKVKALYNVDEASGNTRITPTIDLANLDLSSSTPMNPVDGQPDWYEYTATINSSVTATGPCTWTVTLMDGGRNFVASETTSPITIDNKPPAVATFTVAWDDMPSPLTVGQQATFTLKQNLADGETRGSARIDLSAIGLGTAIEMEDHPTEADKLILTVTATNAATAEFVNYRFQATVFDENGNSATALTNTVGSVDCQPPTFNTYGIIIHKDSPKTGIANIGDQIMVYASASADLVEATATISSEAAIIAEEPMIYNAVTKRHEAIFTVRSLGVYGAENWPELNPASLSFSITGTDDAGNDAASPVTGTTAFATRNKLPSFASWDIWLAPNSQATDIGGIPVLNVASGSPVDLLLASASLAAGAKVSSATIDFSAVQGAPAKYPLAFNNSAATTTAGINMTNYPLLDYGDPLTFYLTLHDEFGNSVTEERQFYVDTRRPSITAATFDGHLISIGCSELIDTYNSANWKLVGSNTSGLRTTLDLSDTAYANDPGEVLFDLDFALTTAGKKLVAGWASTPLYLEISHTTEAPLTDQAGNWLPKASYYPLTITDSSFREQAKITSITMAQNWSTSVDKRIALEFVFDKSVDPAALVASDAVIFVDSPNIDPALYALQGVNYKAAYCFQPEDVEAANLTWTSGNAHLSINLTATASQWIARKLGTGAKTLKFAQRDPNRPFIKDELGKPLTYYHWTSPVICTDNRAASPIMPITVSDVIEPVIDLDSGKITLNFSEEALLFANDFRTINTASPSLGMPIPSDDQAFNNFKNKIHVYYNQDSPSFITLTCDNLSTAANDKVASSSVSISLTTTDINNILSLYSSSAAPNWGIRIDAGAFSNWWGVPSSMFQSWGGPGNVTVIEASAVASVATPLCAVSDMPPTRQDTGNFIFEFELTPATSSLGIVIPIATDTEPKAAIFKTDETTRLASGTFTGWSSRTVGGITRTLAAFKTSEDFLLDVDREPAVLKIFGLKDVLGNPIDENMAVTQVYNRADRVTSGNGFSSLSAEFVLDNVNPEADAFFPGDRVGLNSAGNGSFYVQFNEPMDVLKIPTLTLATGSTVINFSWDGWSDSNRRANYKNLTAITELTANGIWTYTVNYAYDEAGNGPISSSTTVLLLTQAPPVSSVTLQTIQNTVEAEKTLIDQSFSFAVTPGVATLSINYSKVPTDNLPHEVRFYNLAGDLLGTAPITGGQNASATFDSSSFVPALGAWSPTSVIIKIADDANNETGSLKEIIYDGLAPHLDSFRLTGAATLSAGIYYSRSADLSGISAIAESIATDALRLTVASYPAFAATSTFAMTRNGNYSFSFAQLTQQVREPGSYSLGIVDAAGNMHTGSPSLELWVDNASPTVVSINPDTVIGNSPAESLTFTVSFSELMDITTQPTLKLATTTASVSPKEITLTFVAWQDATTAEFTNSGAISETYTPGTYDYQIANCNDLAGNQVESVTGITLNVQPRGPYADITILTLQPAFDPAEFVNMPYSMLVDPLPAGSATIQLRYAGDTAFNAPHNLLVFNQSDEPVAMLPITIAGATGTVIFPGDQLAWAGGAYPTDTTNGSYSFRIIDSLMNAGATATQRLVLDNASATVSNFIFNDGDRGIWDSGIRYYSRNSGSATVTIETDSFDAQRLVASGTATQTFSLTAAGTTHSGLFGGSLADGEYQLTFADLAGNFATESRTIIVDSASPTIVTMTPVITGAVASGAGEFIAVFSEPMNPAAIPVAKIASTTASKQVALTFAGWNDDKTCRFTAAGPIDSTFPAGFYNYDVTNARDLAGNQNEPTTAEVEIYAQSPAFIARLISQQQQVSADNYYFNTPFSTFIEPGVATLSITYNDGPYSPPHTLCIFDSGVQIADTAIAIDGSVGTATLDAGLFSFMNANHTEYRFKIRDSLDNLSDYGNISIIYDTVSPEVSTFTLSNVSPASSDIKYYHNPALHGNLIASAVTTVSTTSASESFRLLWSSDTATTTRPLTTTNTTTHSFAMTGNDSMALAEGSYQVTIVDAAGNFATGATSTLELIVDRQAPIVETATISNAIYLTSGPAGAATFTLTFNEPLLAPPTMRIQGIAPNTASVSCQYVSFSPTEAEFVTAVEVTNQLPQGEYNYWVRATDLTGNVFEGATGTIQVRSRGPVIASIQTVSEQYTTASGTEKLVNRPFSFAVKPGAATLSVRLAQLPDGDLDAVRLHFTYAGATIASVPLQWDGLIGSFTWQNIAGPDEGPLPTEPTSYQMYLADESGDFSLESLAWRIDNATPTVASFSFSGGENNLASSTIYYNYQRHAPLDVSFTVPDESEAPFMRVRSEVSTDTYQLSSAGNDRWTTTFSAVYSRSSLRMPDGIYDVGLADAAGNMAASGTENFYSLVVDTQNPAVSTYSLQISGQPVVFFPPTAGDLDIFVYSEEQLCATGVYYLDIFNTAGTRINRLQLTESAEAYLAIWNGRNAQGNLVADGDYTLRASDYCGNLADTSIKIKTITSEFKTTAATQISSMSARIRFNQEIDVNSIKPGLITSSDGLTVSSIAADGTMAVSFKVSAPFVDATTYLFKVASGTSGIRSVYGSTLATDSISMTADGTGPRIIDHSFVDVSGQRQFKVIFDEAFDSNNAVATTAYTLKNAVGTVIAITLAEPLSDQKTVKITAAQDLIENNDYSIVATGVTDIFGNPGQETPYTFKGRDLTPPVIKVSAFSNPANENDIIVMATSDETLTTAPTLYIKHGNASTRSLAMQARSGNTVFMAGVSLSPAYGNSGTLLVRGEDLSGNQGSGEGTFTIYRASVGQIAQILSADQIVRLHFNADSLKNDATVKILQHELDREASGSSSIQASMQREMFAARGMRFSLPTAVEQQNLSELVPVTAAYEISVDAAKVNKGFSVGFKAPIATAGAGLGLFNQNGNSWKFITADLKDDETYNARLVSSQMLAVMRDVAAPRISLDSKIDLNEPFRVSRPEFSGLIEEAGSGLDASTLVANIDGGLPQPLSIDSNGCFNFKPLAELTSGNHELVIRAADMTGNQTQTAAMRFQVITPLQIDQIMQYPNPASRRGYIRISANSAGLNDDLVKIRIYDTAGHKVTTLSNIKAVKENFGAASERYLYDVLWDLRNDAGKQVANGVYFARIEVRDPVNPAVKVKKTCKLAVLR